MTVGGGVAVWEPREHRLRVLLVDEPMSPSAERQMLDYLQSERLADSGRARAVLEMHFRSNAKTFDRDGLETASLTLTNPDGTVSGTTDVLGSLKWSGNMPPATGGTADAADGAALAGRRTTVSGAAAGAITTLEMSASGGGASPASPAGHDSWQLSIVIPVTQAR